MFVLNHFPLVILTGILVFVLFTWANIYERNNQFIFSLFLTRLFLMLFFTGPIGITNYAYRNKKEIIKGIEVSQRLSSEEKRKRIKSFESKLSLFNFFRRKGMFSYAFFMQTFLEFVEKEDSESVSSLKAERREKDKSISFWEKELSQHIFNH